MWHLDLCGTSDRMQEMHHGIPKKLTSLGNEHDVRRVNSMLALNELN